jgi:hypothetical protein
MMSTNLVSTIMHALPQEAIGRIASTLGLEQSAAQKGISAGVPGILAALANAASTHEGAQRLNQTVATTEQAPSGGDIMRNILSGNVQSIAESGLGMLSSLTGSKSLANLTSVIGQFAGLGQGSVKQILGLLVPVVLSFLKREQTEQGLDARGLATFLSGQRDNIERAMPAGVARNLQIGEARSFTQPPVQESSRFRRPAATVPEGGSRNWAYWLLPALVAAGVIVYLLPPREEERAAQGPAQAPMKETARLQTPPQGQPAPQNQPPQQGQPAPVQASSPASGPAVVALQNDIVSAISRLRTSLQSIKDTGSSQGSLNELKDIAAQFGRLKSQAQQLPPDVRKTLAAGVAARVPDLNGLLDRLGSEGNVIGGEAKPTMDNVKSELLSISKV